MNWAEIGLIAVWVINLILIMAFMRGHVND